MDLEEDVIFALQAGRKIEAIKLIRAYRSMGLKEAKELVDNYYLENPNRVQSVQRANSGGRVVLLVLAAAIAFLIYYYAL